jgi:photosystem II stability/assembly factor-like uncharacterized protein
MKTLINTLHRKTLFVLICLLSFSKSFGQWVESDFTPWNNLYEVAFPSENAAYITGDLGSFYKSTDAGVAWNEIYNFGPFNSVSNLKFINADTGFVMGYENLRTFDGGYTWSSIGQSSKLCISEDILYQSFTSNDTSYIVKSLDFGDSWTILFENYQNGNQAYLISFIDTMNGFMIHPNELDKLYRTIDGGLSFDTIQGFSGDMQLQEEFHFSDTLNGYLYGSWGSESHPTRTWYMYPITVPIDLDGFGVLPVLDLDFNTPYLYAGSLYGKIYYSLNKGQTWFEQITSVSNPIYSISFLNDEMGIAVAGDKVLYTSNGGFTGIDEISQSALTIYPNPASDVVHIKSSEIDNIIGISLKDINGNIIKKISNTETNLDVKNIPPGIYFIQIETENGLINSKLILD